MIYVNDETRRHFESRIQEARLTGSDNLSIFTRQADRVGCAGGFVRYIRERPEATLNNDANSRRRGISDPYMRLLPEEFLPNLTFSARTKEILAQAGSVYQLSTDSLPIMAAPNFGIVRGHKLRTYYNDPHLMHIRARGTEVAVLPLGFIPSRELIHQNTRLSQIEEDTKKRLGVEDIRVIVLEAADYGDLERKHHKATGGHVLKEGEAVITATMVVCIMEKSMSSIEALNLGDQVIQIDTIRSSNAMKRGIIPVIVPASGSRD